MRLAEILVWTVITIGLVALTLASNGHPNGATVWLFLFGLALLARISRLK